MPVIELPAYQPRNEVAQFVKHNNALISDIEKIETKTRRRNLLVNDHIIYQFYETRLPSNVHNRHSLEAWLKDSNEEVLKLDRSTLLQTEVDSQQTAQFPDSIKVHGKTVRIEYKFDPGKHSDGVTMIVPISVLAPFPKYIGEWLVPGLLREKCVALIKTLPKPIRRNYAPAVDSIDRVFNKLKVCLLYTSPSPRDATLSRMPSSA